jgi:hypothetical protein
MEASTVNFPGFVFSKLRLASRGFVLSNGIKHCYIAAVTKMLNNFVWVLLVRYQLIALYCHICLQFINESAILHYLYIIGHVVHYSASKIIHDCMASLSPVGIASLFHHHCQPKSHDIVCMFILSCSRRNYRVK